MFFARTARGSTYLRRRSRGVEGLGMPGGWSAFFGMCGGGRVLSRTPSGDPSSWRMFLQVNDFVLIIQILEGLRTLYECL